MTEKMNRREFLAGIAAGGAALVLSGCGKGTTASSAQASHPRPKHTGPSVLAIATKGATPEARTQAAVAALGGMPAFVKKGDKVAIKANIAWQRLPAQAANTNPEVIKAVIKMCQDAGASEVVLVEHTIDKPAQICFDMSGVKAVAEAAGVRLISGDNEGLYRNIEIPQGKILTKDKAMSGALDADVLINIPIAKVHGASRVSLGMKNLMGLTWDRQAWHNSPDLHQCIADYATAVIPTLTILDANRILLTNGPKGPGKTRDAGTVAASADPVIVDAFGASLFGLTPDQVPYIAKAHEHGLGEMDIKKATVKKV